MKEPLQRDHLFPCPACGYQVFAEPPGSYDICPVCNWEDDEVQLRFPAMQGGANQSSLFAWHQRAAQEFPLNGVIEQHFIRCPDWRPLTEEDRADTTGTPTNGLTYVQAIGTEEPAYYWRTRVERKRDR